MVTDGYGMIGRLTRMRQQRGAGGHRRGGGHRSRADHCRPRRGAGRHQVGRFAGLRRRPAASRAGQGGQRPGPGVARRAPKAAPRHLAAATPGRAGERRRPRRQPPAQAAPVRAHGARLLPARVGRRPHVAVINTVELFSWWRVRLDPIRTAVLGADPATTELALPHRRRPAIRPAGRPDRVAAPRRTPAVVAGRPQPVSDHGL